MCVRDPVTSRSCSAWVQTLFVVWGEPGEGGEGRWGIRDPGRVLMLGSRVRGMDPSTDLPVAGLWPCHYHVPLIPPASHLHHGSQSPLASPAPSSPSVAPPPPPSPAYLQPVPDARADGADPVHARLEVPKPLAGGFGAGLDAAHLCLQHHVRGGSKGGWG